MSKNGHSIGKTIAKLRNEKGWRQADLAKELCVEDKTISRWECEEGLPSISFLPQIAEIFNVSVDYLLTGKCTEPVIITVSKKEECAKNDDLELFNSIDKSSLDSKDDNGKTLFDYIFTYFPQKVMRAYYDAIHPRDIRFDLILGTLQLPWNPSDDGRIVIMQLSRTAKDDIWYDYKSLGRRYQPKDLYYEELFDFIVTNFERINKSSLNLYLSQFRSATNKLFERAVELLPDTDGEAIIEYLLNFTEEYNSKKYYSKPNDYEGSKVYFSIHLSEHADALLDKGFIDYAKRCDKHLDTSKIELAELKKIGKGNTKAAEILKYEHNGVLDVYKLLETDDYELVEAAFKKHENIVTGNRPQLIKSFADNQKGKYKLLRFEHNCHERRAYSRTPWVPNQFSQTSYNYIHPTVETAEEAISSLNKCYKNNQLALLFVRTKREKFSKNYRMVYICDYYNRHLYEECIEASYYKLKEFFEIACKLKGTMSEMLEKYYNDFEPGCINGQYTSGNHYNEERLIKDVLQEIIDAYDRVQKDSFEPTIFSKDCLKLLGEIYKEEVYFPKFFDGWE